MHSIIRENFEFSKVLPRVQVEGDSLTASWKTIWVNVALADNVTQFEAVTPTGPVTGSHCRLHTRNITFDVTYDRNLSLNKRLREMFKKEIAAKVTKELVPICFLSNT